MCSHTGFIFTVSFFVIPSAATDNVTNSSLMLRALTRINLAPHIMFSPRVAFCLQLLTPNYSLSLPLLYFPSHCPLTWIRCDGSPLHPPSFLFLRFKYFSRPHFIYIPASSPRLPIHRSLHISFFLSPPVSPPWQPWPS